MVEKNITSLVSAATDMEINSFTLKEAAKKWREEAQKREKNKMRELSGFENDLKTQKERLDNVVQSERNSSFRNYCRSTRNGWRVFGFIWLHYFCGCAFVMGIITVLETLLYHPNSPWIISPAVTPGYFYGISIPSLIVLYFAIFFLIWFCVKKRNYRAHKRSLSQSAHFYKKEVREAELLLEQRKKDYEAFQAENNLLYVKAEELETAASEIQKNLSECYNLGIIPPSYRNLVCLVIIDSILLNDKADTMREAILLCDTELRHYELINKLNDIYLSLKALASGIQRMNEVLEEINLNVRHISTDVFEMKQIGKDIAYVSESLKSSAENTDFYIAQRRAGAL